MKKWFALGLSLCVVGGVTLNNVMAGEKEHKKEQTSVAAGFVETSSGLQYEDKTVGTGEEARSGDSVAVHYTGTLYPGGEKFDSSLDRGQPFVFDLGAGQVISGWDQGVAGMREGGKRVLIIPGKLAYGHRGVPGVIPPDATLQFEVELLKVD